MKKTRLLIGLITCLLLCTTGFLAIAIIPQQNAATIDSAPIQAAQTGYIEVRVYNSENGNPISSATVQLTGTGTALQYTDTTGFTNFTNLNIGWHYVKVSKVGYYSQNKSDFINWDGDDDYLTFNLDPMPADSGFIEVTVRRSEDSSLFSGAYVKCYDDNDILVWSGTTLGTGVANVTGLYIGWHRVTVSYPGRIPQSKNDYINWNGDDDYLTFYLVAYPPNSGWIECTVKDNASVPLSGALVKAFNQTTQTVTSSGYTNAQGKVNVTGLGIGWWTIQASKVGYYSQNKSDYINWNGDDDYLTFYLTPKPADSGYIEVKVKYANATPVSNAYVYVIDDETGLLHKSGVTNGAGFFNVTGCTIGWYEVIVQKVGYVQQTKMDYINWAGDDDYLYYYLQPLDDASISLKTLVRRSTNPAIAIPNAQVQIWQGGAKVAEGSTGNWGYFQADNLDNTTTATIIASAPGYNTTTVTGVDLTTTTEKTVLLMPNAGTIFGYIEVKVRELHNASINIANATVRVTFPNGTISVVGNTSATGFLNITSLDIGWHAVEISKTGYITQTKNDYINWDGDDDYLYYYLARVAFSSQTLTLQNITPNPDPTGDIDLYWNDVSHEVNYEIYRGPSAAALELVTTVGAGVTYYKDVGVTGDVVYYQIVAVNATGATLLSNIESVEIYSEGGAIPGFELVFLLIAVAFIVVAVRRKKSNFSGELKI